eukprot:6201571-Pleurochrysis_carterae.AAC.1
MAAQGARAAAAVRLGRLGEFGPHGQACTEARVKRQSDRKQTQTEKTRDQTAVGERRLRDETRKSGPLEESVYA